MCMYVHVCMCIHTCVYMYVHGCVCVCVCVCVCDYDYDLNIYRAFGLRVFVRNVIKIFSWKKLASLMADCLTVVPFILPFILRDVVGFECALWDFPESYKGRKKNRVH